MLRSAPHSGIAFLTAFAIALVAGTRLPRADDPRYIDFAGPTAPLVWSNAAILLAGLAGLLVLARVRIPAKWPAALFFAGNVATAFGSAYFHLQPDLGVRLAWDRLPMTIAFAAFVGMHIDERIRMGLGTRLTLPLAALGAATVWWWLRTQDLSFYSAYQAFASGGTLFMLLLFTPTYDGDRWYYAAIVLYGLAKVGELFDRTVFDAIGVSGHTIKHLLAAAATGAVVVHVRLRSARGMSPL